MLNDTWKLLPFLSVLFLASACVPKDLSKYFPSREIPPESGSPTPIASESPTPTETPVASESPAPTETPVASESPTPTETPVASESPTPSETPVADLDCDLSAYLNNGVDAAHKLQACFDAAPAGSTLALSPGTYVIGKMVTGKGVSLKTKGLSPTDAQCSDTDDARCAVLLGSIYLSPYTPMISFQGDNLSIDHVVFHGNGSFWRWDNWSYCVYGSYYMYTVAIGSPYTGEGSNNFSMTNSVIADARCAGGVWVGYSTNQTFTKNKFLRSGAHVPSYGSSMVWATGIAFLGNDTLEFSYNTFEDNSDGDMQLGNLCVNCSVHDNTFIHKPLENPTGVAHCAICTGPYAEYGAEADYTGTSISHNWIDCGARSRGPGAVTWGCGFGIDWGQGPWKVRTTMKGGYIGENTILNAMVGIYVGASTGLTMGTNTIDFGFPNKGCMINPDTEISPRRSVYDPNHVWYDRRLNAAGHCGLP